MTPITRWTCLACLGLLCISAGGCATALRGDSQKMKFNSDPSGATIKINDQTYTTPVEVSLKRKDIHKIEVSKAGYRTKIFDLKAQWDGASLPGLVLPGGSVSVATDRVSGADLSFDDLPTIKLDAAAPGTPPQQMVVYRKKLLTVDDYEKVLEEERLEALRHRE